MRIELTHEEGQAIVDALSFAQQLVESQISGKAVCSKCDDPWVERDKFRDVRNEFIRKYNLEVEIANTLTGE